MSLSFRLYVFYFIFFNKIKLALEKKSSDEVKLIGLINRNRLNGEAATESNKETHPGVQ